MKGKEIHFGLSILSFFLGLVCFLSDLVSDATIERLSLLFFALVLLGGYGITKYFYEK